MRVIRALLIVVFGLLAALVVSDLWKGPRANTQLNWTVLAIFIFIIVVLGPLWPSKAKMQRWAAALDRATGIPNVTPIVVNALGAVYSLYMVLNTYAHPNREFHRFERPIASVFGADGVMIAWLLICAGCLTYGYRFYKISKASQQRSNL
jgi:uncharacterized protein YacL